MNNFKQLMWSGVVVLVMLSVFLLVSTNRVLNTTTTTNTISVSGEGKVFAKPDIIVVSFSIVTEAKTSKGAQNQNSEKSKTTVSFLKSQEIEDKDIKTIDYNIYPQYNYPKPLPLGTEVQSYPVPDYYPGNPKITGYQVSQSFEIKIRDLEKVSIILDGLVAAGTNQVSNLDFKIDNKEELKNEARESAIKDAKDKANRLKKQIGIRLGKIVNYYESGNYPRFYAAEAKLSDFGGDTSGPSVPTGENEIVVNVTITYQIK